MHDAYPEVGDPWIPHPHLCEHCHRVVEARKIARQKGLTDYSK